MEISAVRNNNNNVHNIVIVIIYEDRVYFTRCFCITFGETTDNFVVPGQKTISNCLYT